MRHLLLSAALTAALCSGAEARCRLDGAGRVSVAAAAEEMSPAASQWMRVAMGTAVSAELAPPAASRLYAATVIAMHDGYAAATGGSPYAVRVAPSEAAAEDAPAVVQYAAAAFLSRVYPGVMAWYGAKLDELVAAGDRTPAARALGEEIGRRVFERCFYTVQKFPPSERARAPAPGEWRPTLSYYQSGLEPGWPDREPFELLSAGQFRPEGPPALNSKTYARAVADVESLGAQLGGARSEEQTLIARFWEDGMQTSTPPGHWNGIALEAVASLPLGRQLEILLTLNITLADAGLAAWDAKYHYRFWRPITAIREAVADGNPATAPDARWWPYIESPMFPDYVSGHSTFSAAAATVLTHYLGVHPIAVGTESMVGGVRRSFSSFEEAAEEAGMSRIYGGIHFQFSNRDGQGLGKKVGAFVIDRMAERILADTSADSGRTRT